MCLRPFRILLVVSKVQKNLIYSSLFESTYLVRILKNLCLWYFRRFILCIISCWTPQRIIKFLSTIKSQMHFFYGCINISSLLVFSQVYKMEKKVRKRFLSLLRYADSFGILLLSAFLQRKMDAMCIKGSYFSRAPS